MTNPSPPREGGRRPTRGLEIPILGRKAVRMTHFAQPNRFTRRQALQAAACGFGSLALAGLSADKAAAATQLMHHAPRAKRVIFLFMAGGVSQVDSFDHKPILDRFDTQMIEVAYAP